MRTWVLVVVSALAACADDDPGPPPMTPARLADIPGLTVLVADNPDPSQRVPRVVTISESYSLGACYEAVEPVMVTFAGVALAPGPDAAWVRTPDPEGETYRCHPASWTVTDPAAGRGEMRDSSRTLTFDVSATP